jgi:methylmalonyl-CoA mutase N-terminal domain/subunit
VKTVVGVNRYQLPEERPPEILRVPLEVEGRQRDRVATLKRERNGTAARDALKRVRDAAESGENLMPALVTAVKAYCTVGEISDVYRQVFGEYRDPAWL